MDTENPARGCVVALPVCAVMWAAICAGLLLNPTALFIGIVTGGGMITALGLWMRNASKK